MRTVHLPLCNYTFLPLNDYIPRTFQRYTVIFPLTLLTAQHTLPPLGAFGFRRVVLPGFVSSTPRAPSVAAPSAPSGRVSPVGRQAESWSWLRLLDPWESKGCAPNSSSSRTRTFRRKPKCLTLPRAMRPEAPPFESLAPCGGAGKSVAFLRRQ